MATRWDGDDRGHGIGDAARLVAGASELVVAFTEPGWVAEQPELHLLPHIEAWCERHRRLALTGAHSDDAGALVLDLRWLDATAGLRSVRAAAFSLIGAFAESASYVRQRRAGDGPEAVLQFEVVTGEPAPDAEFDPHGHVVVINIRGALGGE